LKYSYLYNLLT